MEQQKKKRNNFLFGLKIFGILLCTIIGGYGILGAPDSDQAKLEEELKRNEEFLQNIENEATNVPDSLSAIPSHSEESAWTATAAAKESDSPAAASSISSGVAAATTNARERSISVIGDSVFLGAAPAFRKYYENAVIDAKVSRQVYQALDVAKKLEKKKKLGNTVIIALGINGNFNPATGQALIDYLGKDREIYWINAYGEDRDIQKKVNKTIQQLVETNQHVHLIDWAAKAKKHPDWFYQDETHLNAEGQAGYAKFIKESIS